MLAPSTPEELSWLPHLAPTSLSLPLTSIIALAATLLLFKLLSRPPLPPNAPKEWTSYDWPIAGSAVAFYNRRRDMLAEGTKASVNGDFSFYVGKKHVVSVGSLAGRRALYETKELDFGAGFVELLVGIPSWGEPDKEAAWARRFYKVVQAITTWQNLTQNIPLWASDIQDMCNGLAGQTPAKEDGEWRVFDSVETMYGLVYRLSMRFMGSTELADDPARLTQTLSIFEQFEASGGVENLIFPWLVTPTHVQRIYLGIKLYISLLGAIRERQRSGRKERDALQYLLDQGLKEGEVIKMQISTIWAGVVTTGVIASWLPVLLASSPEWKAKCQHEVLSAIARHRTCGTQSSGDVLQALGIEAWDLEFPVLDSCIRETIRVVTPGTVFRKNTSAYDIPIGTSGRVIPAGSFAAFNVDDVHMNPVWYPDPQTFNPARFLDRAARGTEPHVYVGWGSGAHPCIGMKVAKLELTMLMAFFIGQFKFGLSNKQGDSVAEGPPLPDRNGHQGRKSATPIYLRCRHANE